MEEAGKEQRDSSRGSNSSLLAWGDGLERQEEGEQREEGKVMGARRDGDCQPAHPVMVGTSYAATFSCTGPFLHLDLSFQHRVMLSVSYCVAPAQGVDRGAGGSSVQCKDPKVICVKM